MGMPWFRMYAEFANDAKVQSMPEVMQRRLIMIFCLRCSDVTVTLCDEELAFHLRISDAELAETKALFVRKGFIDKDWSLTRPIEVGEDRPPSHIWRIIRDRIFRRDDYTCHYCGQRGKRLECDHVVPLARGGSNDDDNLVTACFKCIRAKHSKLVSEWRHA